MSKVNELIDELREEDDSISLNAIKRIIPYDDPFLFISRIIKLNEREIQAEKHFDSSMEFIQGHFVGFPIIPGALITEGFGQTGTILIRYNLEDHLTKDILVCRIEDARFLSPAFPGDSITYTVRLSTMNHRAARIEGNAMIGGKKISTYRMVMGIVDRPAFRNSLDVKISS